MAAPERDMAGFIRTHTRVGSPLLCPELRLHLITAECHLWRAGEAEVQALGIPEPYWAFCWAGGQALARHLLDHPQLARGRRVLDFGSGGAVEGIAAARAGAACVLAVDIDPWAAEAARMNAALNGVALSTATRDPIGEGCEEHELVLAGDVAYEPAFAGRVLAWLRSLAGQGREVLLADPGRGYLATADLEALANLRAPADVDDDARHLRETTVYRVRP
ncbi:MAG TPA: 50S ribosomal protein L11 methyltransferase [Myxococcota bacterium]|nr:50S ribosomal protein L11 methyltransferase [Myxococcota bacterium]HRY95875.1 50S ribosomal protein L11 methyltransferase [Myxococcota bacterium]HSA22108.1 50S ribosomal protein L11 methyltransferase [Myxococcota bacterium]